MREASDILGKLHLSPRRKTGKNTRSEVNISDIDSVFSSTKAQIRGHNSKPGNLEIIVICKEKSGKCRTAKLSQMTSISC